MHVEYTGLMIVIPTRNRAQLAINAIRSVLDQPLDKSQIIVSDNSTVESEVDELNNFCKISAKNNILYLRPPAPMPMSAHWDWVMTKSLDFSNFSHFTYLTDRMIFKNDKLATAIEIIKRQPNKILCYNHDEIVDLRIPIRIIQAPWTGKIFEIDSKSLLALIAKGNLHNSLPRMLNSIVPRSCIQKIRRDFGNVFDSISPDFCFCFRSLEIFDTVLFFDESILYQYALYRSNGKSIAIGNETKDYKDFIQNLGNKSMNYASPVPEFMTVYNAICHEYCLIKEQTRSKKFREIDTRSYLEMIATEIDAIENLKLKREMENLLEANGWEGKRKTTPEKGCDHKKLFSARAVMKRLKGLSKSPHAKRAWVVLANRFALMPPDENEFQFRTTGEAIEYANRFPRRRQTTRHLGEPLSTARILEGLCSFSEETGL